MTTANTNQQSSTVASTSSSADARQQFPMWLARLMLLVSAAVWGSGYTVIKFVQATIPSQWLMALRVGFATLLIVIVFLPRLRKVRLQRMIVPGLLLAVSYWLGFFCQLKGLETTAPGRNSFLTGTYCVMVPFIIWAVTRRNPGWQHLLAACVCVIGIGCVSLGSVQGSAWAVSFGDGITVLGAFFYAVNLVTVGFLARKFDPMALMMMEFAFATVFFIAGGLVTEPLPSPAWFQWQIVAALAYLIIGSTLIAQLFQIIAVKYLPTSQASIILSTESLFGVLVSVLFYGEQLTGRTLAGFSLIFGAILLSELHLPKRGRNAKRVDR